MNEIIQRYIEQYKFSDIHLKENQPVMLRVNGDMITPEEDIISSSELRLFANESLTEGQLLLLIPSSTRNLNKSLV